MHSTAAATVQHPARGRCGVVGTRSRGTRHLHRHAVGQVGMDGRGAASSDGTATRRQHVKWLDADTPGNPTELQLRQYGCASLEEYTRVWRERREERNRLRRLVQSDELTSAEKQALVTSYVVKWGKTPFQCPTCWLLPYMCVCNGAARAPPEPELGSRPRVLVWLHEREWGKASNTGTVLAMTLGEERCRMLVHGLPEHSHVMEEAVRDPTRTLAVLWPGDGAAVGVEELARVAGERTGGRVTLVALDGTWRQGRSLNACLPDSVMRVALPLDAHGVSVSLLRPIRRYRGCKSERISTCEAVGAALELLGEPPETVDALDFNMRRKVDSVLCQKHQDPIFGTVEAPFQRRNVHPNAERLAAMAQVAGRKREGIGRQGEAVAVAVDGERGGAGDVGEGGGLERELGGLQIGGVDGAGKGVPG